MQQRDFRSEAVCRFNNSCTRSAVDTCMNTETCGVPVCGQHSVRRGDFLLCRHCEENPPREFLKRVLRDRLVAGGYSPDLDMATALKVLNNSAIIPE